MAKNSNYLMKSVLISIRPEWCEKIASGQKTIEVRKTRPNLPTPFKCYIYCTAGGIKKMPIDYINENFERAKVIGEFVCDRIQKTFEPAGGLVDVIDCRQSCLTAREIISYAGGKALYFWHISDLKIYDTPKELGEFKHCGGNYHFNPAVTRPPQSWCYVE